MLSNFKRVIALLSVFALLIVYVPITMAADEADTVTIYHETFGNGIGVAVQSGGASLTQVTDKAFVGNDDEAALYVSSRTNNWDAADFFFDDIGLEEGKTYTVTVTGYIDSDETIPDGANVQLQPVGSDYGWIDGKPMAAGEAFTLSGTYTVDGSKHDRLRVQSNDASAAVPFYVGDILIIAEEDAPGEPVTREVYHETFGNGIGAAVQSGGASLTQVTGKAFVGNDDEAALYVSNRTNNWDAADFKFGDIGLVDGITFTITVTGYIDSDETIPDGANVQLQPVGSNDYGWINGCQRPMAAGEAFTLSGTYTVDGSKHDRLRVQSDDNGASVPFYIGDILITTDDPTYRPPAQLFTTVTFEGGQADNNGGFVGRGGVETLTVTDEDNHTEGGSKALKVEGREQTWNGPSLNVERYIDQGYEYKVTAWVKLIQPASTQIALSTQVGNGSGASYNNLQTQNITTDNGWVKFEGTYRYTNMKSDYATIYVESPTSTSASFYIDDISFEPTGSGPQDIERDLTPIKDVYKNDFLIGNAISAEDLEGVRLDLLKMHHNVVTAGNAMKPDALQPTKGNFTFDAADDMVNKVLAEGMLMHGHTLVWHSQSPDWLNKNANGNPLGREEALENMRTHIKNVVEHFGNRVISWDVVNEAMNDNPTNPTNWRAALRKSPWYYAIGDDYVEQAFLAAREVLDEHPDWNIKLYYNDYNDDNQNKATSIYSMVKELNDKYAAEHDGKLLIDGIGMQAHYNLSTNPENVKLSLERFASLGVEVSVTELDIMAGSNRQLSEDQKKAQAYLYAQLFKIYKEHADDITRVTFWGMDDGTSWRSDNSPLLFDKNLKAKAAYYAVIDPETYIEENPPEEKEEAMQSTATYGTPVVDGVIDSIWNSISAIPINRYQMAWQGATGTAKTLWDENNLYVLVQVNDDQLNKASANAYEQDSIEVFIDENNAKTTYYEDDDGQYRVNYDNETTFNPESIGEGFESATAVDGTNYVVEVKIPFKTITPGDNVKIGFDVQINDAKDGSRISIANWNDLTGNAYQDTSVFGVLTLKTKGSDDSGSGSSYGNSFSSTPDVKVEQTEGRAEISVNVPATKSSDGSVTAGVYDSYIDAVVKAAENFKKNNADQASTIRFALDTSADKVTARLPEKALEKILGADPDASLEIASGQCELQLDNKALEAVSKTGNGIIEINVSKLGQAELDMIPSEAVEKIGDRPIFNIVITNGGNAVTDFSGGTLTVSIPYEPAEGEDPNAILVYYIDSNNDLVPVVSRYVNGKVIFTTTHLSKYAIGYNKVSFTDVKPTDYFYAPITYLGARGIITGSSFEPERAMTRGEAVVMILKAYGIEPLDNPTDNFSDLSGEYAGYYAKAKAIGLSNGIGNNIFGADLELTREMLFTMVGRMENVVGEFTSVAEGRKVSSFSDYKELSGWAMEEVSKLTEKGIIIGAENNTLKPKAIAKRSETVTMLYKLVNG
jgi:endo-1,4-beta-xylanase